MDEEEDEALEDGDDEDDEPVSVSIEYGGGVYACLEIC